MAVVKLYNNGFPTVETNDLFAVKTGSLKSQYPFVKGAGNKMVDNGIALVVDETGKKIVRPTTGKEKVGLHVSEERIYEGHLGRKTFQLNGDVNVPRVALLKAGDVFETDAIVMDNAMAIADAKYVVPHTDGYWRLVTQAETVGSPAAVVLADYAVVGIFGGEVMLPKESKGVRIVIDTVKS
jgi:hypothetical protein